MKSYTTIIAILLTGLFLSACGSKKKSTDLDALISTKDSLVNAKESIETQIASLDAQIAELDTNFTEKPLAVEVRSIEKKDLEHYIRVQGQLVSDNNVMVSPKSPGVVTAIYVKEGQNVTKGQKLAQTDNTVIKRSMDELNNQLDLAKTIYEKQKRLWDQKIGSEIQYLQAKNQVESLEKRIATTEEQLAMTTITAPISGVVDQVITKIGEGVSPGFGAFRIVNLNDIRFQAEVSEAYIPQIKKGDKVTLKFPTINKEVESKITFIGSTINPISRMIVIEASLPKKDANLKANMIGEMIINDETAEDALVVEQNVLQKTTEGYVLFIADKSESSSNWVAKRVLVEQGLIADGKAEIRKGLNEGDKLVTVGFQDLSDGQKIKFEQAQ